MDLGLSISGMLLVYAISLDWLHNMPRIHVYFFTLWHSRVSFYFILVYFILFLFCFVWIFWWWCSMSYVMSSNAYLACVCGVNSFAICIR
jgi:hypothetical protein